MTTIDTDVVKNICADECKSKCCDFYTSNFHARVNIEDYKRLKQYELDRFIIWDHGDPQLASKPNGKCIFLDSDTNLCNIYNIRPLDCRNFPYFMPESNIPKHCLLYNRSSEELIEEQKRKTQDVPEFTKELSELTEIEKEYINLIQTKPSISFDIFSEELEITDDNLFFSVLYNEEADLDLVEKTIEKYSEDDNKTKFTVYSILGMNNESEYIYHILGIQRENSETDIPIISQFPPDMNELNSLLQWVNENSYWHLKGGLELPDNLVQDIMS